jgi:hypothetical protein
MKEVFMNDKEAPSNSDGEKSPLLPDLKDAAVLKDAAIISGWIIFLMLIAGFCWYLAQPLRNSILQRSLNRALEQSGEMLRLGEAASPKIPRAGFGSFFEVSRLPDNRAPGGEIVFVFTIIADGYFFPCAAVIGHDGRVQDLIPLGSHAARMMNRISPGILQLYTRRIEGAGL